MEVTSEANGLDVIQSMIDISADRLEGLRTQCATSASLTQQEIRSLETKLVRMFSELLLTKARLPERIPSSGLATSSAELRQWLRVVGLSQESLNICLQRLNTLEQLLEMSETELKQMLSSNANLREEEHRRLSCAIQNLRKCRDSLRDGNKEPDNLYWDSWDRHHHVHHYRNLNNAAGFASPRNYRTAVKQAHKARQSPVGGSGEQIVQSPSAITTPEDAMHSSTHTLTPSPSPPNSPCLNTLSSSSGNNNSNQKLTHRKSGTPPPKKKHQTLLPHHPSTPSHTPASQTAASMTGSGNNINQDPMAPLTKSKSHESQLMQDNSQPGTGNNNSNNNVQQQKPQTTAQTTTYPHHPIPRTRLHTEPGPDLPSQVHHYPYNTEVVVENTNNLTVPRSPCTPIVSLGMGHQITHRFTKVFKVMSTCDLCQKQMFFGLKCKECKYRCHKDCEPNVPPSCGLPREFVDEFKRTLQSGDVFLPNTSPNLGSRSGYLTAGRMTKNPIAAYHAPDSSSPGSSCNSSSPSSPALFNVHHQHSQQHAVTQLTTPSSAQKTASQFNFPEVSTSSTHPTHQHAVHHPKGMSGALDSPLTTVSSANCSSTGTNSSSNYQANAHNKVQQYNVNNNAMPAPLSELVDTHRSNDSDKTVSLSGSTSASTDSDRTPVRLDSTEEGDSGNWPRQNSLSLKEWDIPYGDLKLLEEIGKGRFGTVHRALWHGDVAVKLLKEDYLNDAQTLDAFKLEVATFKKTRHENLVLFMGACMNPPFLAIVTSLCKGNTLYTYIHIRRDKFNLNRSTLVAQQISQGMGYLHARGIFHKDLRTKNIFLENGKVIITDFGLFSSTKLMYCDLGLCIPNGWLCYLSPELVRTLTPHRPSDEILPFSKSSDVYSFGTVWYELLCGEFPFKMQSSEAIIWQVGRGMKQTLANLQTSRDVKDILMFCWAFQADDRPTFSKLLTLLERLPKKRLARSPSHPVQLSRSAESVF